MNLKGMSILVYLDNAATTKPCTEAVNAVTAAMTEHFGNPSSLHRAGLDAQLAVDGARKIIADSIGADVNSVYFTSGATESSNLAIRGVAGTYGRRNKKVITTTYAKPKPTIHTAIFHDSSK